MLIKVNLKELAKQLNINYWNLRYLSENDENFFVKKIYNGNNKSKIKKHTYWLDEIAYKEYLIQRNKLDEKLGVKL